jgi:hypothetical protein
MAFKGKNTVKSKTELKGKALEKVCQFNYQGCELNISGEPNIDKRLNIFQRICGSIRRHLKKT